MISNKLHNMLFKVFCSTSLAIYLMVLPLYTADASGNTDILAQVPTVSIFFSPAQATLPPNGTLGLEIDAGSYQIAFARIDLTFDPSMIQLTNEVQTTSLLGTVIQITSMNDANASGQITIVLGLSTGALPPTGIFEFAQLRIRGATTLSNQITSISVVDQNVQIVDTNVTNLPFVSQSATLTINPIPSLLRNPSFEDDMNNDGKPDIWSTSAKFTRVGIPEITAVDGSYVGRFRATDNSGANSTQTVLNLTAGTTYNFTSWVNIPTQGDATFTFKIQVIWKNGSGSNISTTLVKDYAATTSGWNQATKTMVAPAGTVKAVVKMVASSLNGSIYVDKFQFSVR